MKLQQILEAPPLRTFDIKGLSPEHGSVEHRARHPAFKKRVENVFKNLKFPVDVVFMTTHRAKLDDDRPGYTIPWSGREAPFRDEFGRLPKETIRQGYPNDPSAITILILGPGEAYKTDMPLTPWMIAHRLSHAMYQEFHEDYSVLEQAFRPYVETYARNFVPRPEVYHYYLFPFFVDILDTRSARQGKIEEEGEELHELVTSYIVRGRTKLTRGNRSEVPNWIPETALRELEKKFDRIIGGILKKAVGNTYYIY